MPSLLETDNILIQTALEILLNKSKIDAYNNIIADINEMMVDGHTQAEGFRLASKLIKHSVVTRLEAQENIAKKIHVLLSNWDKGKLDFVTDD